MDLDPSQSLRVDESLNMPGEIVGWTYIPFAVYRGPKGEIAQEVVCAEVLAHGRNIEGIQDEAVRRLYPSPLLGYANDIGVPPISIETDGTIVATSIELRVVVPIDDLSEIQDVLVRRARAAREKGGI